MERLNIRFQVDTVQTLETALEGIDDLQRLKQLRRAAAKTESLEAFKHLLENAEDSV